MCHAHAQARSRCKHLQYAHAIRMRWHGLGTCTFHAHAPAEHVACTRMHKLGACTYKARLHAWARRVPCTRICIGSAYEHAFRARMRRLGARHRCMLSARSMRMRRPGARTCQLHVHGDGEVRSPAPECAVIFQAYMKCVAKHSKYWSYQPLGDNQLFVFTATPV